MASPPRNRKRIRAPLRALDGSAFLKCDECGSSVAAALLDMHECQRRKDVQRFKGKCDQLVVKELSIISDEPRSAFHFFLESYTKTCVGRDLIEVDREAFHKWKKMTTKEQMPYVLQAEKVEIAYMEAIRAEVNQLPQVTSVALDDDDEDNDEPHYMGGGDDICDESSHMGSGDDIHDGEDTSGSRVPPKRRNMKPTSLEAPPDPSKKKLITPVGTTSFSDFQYTSRIMKQIWYVRYKKPWHCFSNIPDEEIKIWEDEFRKYFTWDPKHELLIWRNWRETIQRRIRQQLYVARKTSVRPHWLPPSAWTTIQERWNLEAYIEMRRKNKANRWKYIDHTSPVPKPRGTHRSGAMPFSRRIQKLGEELGREPSVLELYERTHVRPDGSRIDNVSLTAFQEQLQRELDEEAQRLGIQDRELTPLEKVAPTNKAWMASHGIDAHGRVFSLGNEASNFRESQGYRRATVRVDPLKITERLSQGCPEEGTKGKGKKKMSSKTSTTQPQEWPPAYYVELEAFMRAYDRGETNMSLRKFAKFLAAKYQDVDSDSD